MMAKGRMLKKEISESKKLGGLRSDSSRLLYTWLIPWLDIEGRYTADIDILKGHLFPKVRSITPEIIEELLFELAEQKLIILYKSNGEQYLQFTKFRELQTLHPEREAKSEIPSPSEKSCELMITHDLSPQVKLKEVKLKEVKVNINDYTSEFESFWKEYPKLKGKKVAFIAWNEHPKKNYDELILAARNYKKECINLKTDLTYIKEPSGFIRLSKEYWKDFLEEPKNNSPKFPRFGKSQLPEETPEKKKSDDEYLVARRKEEKRLVDKYKDLEFEERGHKIQDKLAKWTKEYYGKETGSQWPPKTP